ncbi:MAG: ABC transporter ATP-binding protein [Candidatus Poribacteria bacterium]|nr:ABC transporter ATP-binding protein [Candidatus Poribacteria bacterium]
MNAQSENTNTPILEITNLSKHFGGVIALSQIDMYVPQGQIASLIGPNGAGKTTLFNCITGLERPTAGAVQLQTRSITGLRPDQITSIGMARTFQNIRLFSQLTVLDNIKIGRHCRSKSHFWAAIRRNHKQRQEEAEITEYALEALKFVGLERYSDQIAGNLSYGDGRRIEIARALATEPTLLLLDEPAAGMNPLETQHLMDLIYAIRQQGITVLLIEHDMKVVMRISDWVTVLDHGEKISHGKPEAVQNDARVIKAYLGKSYNA